MKSYTLDGEPVELDAFIADNCGHTVSYPFEDEDITDIYNLKPGEEIRFGGGASAEFVLACHEGTSK